MRTPVAIVGSGFSESYEGMARAIDAFPEVWRFGMAATAANIAAHPECGTKTTRLFANCKRDLGMTIFDGVPTSVAVVMMGMLQNNEEVERRLREAGFGDVSQLRRVPFARSINGERSTPVPTNGIIAVKKAILDGMLPVVFNFSQEDIINHYFDNVQDGPDNVHNMANERLALSQLESMGLVLIDNPFADWRRPGWTPDMLDKHLR